MMVRTLASVLVLLLQTIVVQAASADRTELRAAIEGQDIAVILYRPPGPGPFPLAILSHGSPGDPTRRATVGERTLERQADWLVAEGIAVALPIRRGYAGQGAWREGYGSCEAPDYGAAGAATARDIAAALHVVRSQPGIDPTRIVLVGHSAGGWGSVAFPASERTDGVLGIVNLAGGRGAAGPGGTVCGEDRLAQAAARFGTASRLPELWIYSRNDRSFPEPVARRLHEAFTAAGGRATLIAAPPYGSDGHLFIRSAPLWKPETLRFLREIGLLP